MTGLFFFIIDVTTPRGTRGTKTQYTVAAAYDYLIKVFNAVTFVL